MKFKALQSYFPYFLLIYHLSFAWFAYDYVNQNNGDAVKYWFVGVNLSKYSWFDFLQPGTLTINFITYPLVKYLHLSPLVGCFLFSAWSGYGFYRLWNLCSPFLLGKKRLSWVVIGLLFLPNTHFWTSLIGKEAFLFLPMVLIVEKIFQEKYRSWELIWSLFLVAWVRPHLVFVLILSFSIAFLWKSNANLKIKSGILGAFLILSSFAYLILRKITFTQGDLWDKIQRLYVVHNEKLKGTNSYVPMEDYAYPYKLFTFYFRPLPLEKSGFLYAVISWENFILLLVFVFFIVGLIRNYRNLSHQVFLVFGLIFLVVHGAMYAYGYANYGLIMRTKALVFPFLAVLFLVLLEAKSNLEKEKKI
jgi:hypothetical protein